MKQPKKHTFKNKNDEDKQMDINAIPNNMEKYMAFMLGKHLIFLDSFQFMSSSLDTLANNIPDEAFKYTSKVFKDEKFKLMKRITRTAVISLIKNYQEKMNFTVFFKMTTHLPLKKSVPQDMLSILL